MMIDDAYKNTGNIMAEGVAASVKKILERLEIAG